MTDICLNIEPFLNPSPSRNPGGDCFACAMTAALRHLYPDQPPDFNQVWDTFMNATDTKGEKVLNNTWHGMQSARWGLKDLGYKLDLRIDFVRPGFGDTETWSYQWWHFLPEGEWAYRLEAWLRAGWVALAEMMMEGQGPLTPDLKFNHTDHFVVLDGQKHFWKQHETVHAGYSLEHETHVVCSRKGAYWIDTRDLLLRHGVAAIILIRPDDRIYVDAQGNPE